MPVCCGLLSGDGTILVRILPVEERQSKRSFKIDDVISINGFYP